jgi:ribosomal protein S18 acetylase RimI-like enzyme
LGLTAQGWLGLFDIATAPEQRNRGLGRAVVSSLLRWGRECGAQTAFLQVVPQNAPALQLYAGLGFREIYQYWYRAL